MSTVLADVSFPHNDSMAGNLIAHLSHTVLNSHSPRTALLS